MLKPNAYSKTIVKIKDVIYLNNAVIFSRYDYLRIWWI